jgi:hypothetical protein
MIIPVVVEVALAVCLVVRILLLFDLMTSPAVYLVPRMKEDQLAVPHIHRSPYEYM